MLLKRLFAFFGTVLLLALIASCASRPASETSFGLCENGHNLVEVAEIAPTDEEDGVLGHFECSVCHALFDAAGTRVTPEDLTIPSLATAVETNHKHVKTKLPSEQYLASPATCTKRAAYHVSCEVCGFAYAETFTVGEPLGHTGGDATCRERAICTRCGKEYGSLGAHNPAEIVCDEARVAEADCLRGALYRKTCSLCGKLLDDTFVSGDPIADNHDYAPDPLRCDDTMHTLVCRNCGDTITGAHRDASTSCMMAATCENCGMLFFPDTHDYSLHLVREDFLATPADCEHAATYYVCCSFCHKKSDKTFSSGDPAGHAFVDSVCKHCGKREESGSE